MIRIKPLAVTEARQELLNLYQTALPHLAERRNRNRDGLTRLQMHVLHMLERDGPQPMRELAACLGVTPTSVTGIGNALVRRGLVERREDPADRRVRLLCVTGKGRETLARMRRLLARELERALAALDASERAQFVSLVSRLLATVVQEDSQAT